MYREQLRRLIRQQTLKANIENLVINVEKSAFGKLVLYENLISFSTISLIKLIVYYKNCTLSGFPIVLNGKKLEERTLGDLEIELGKYSPGDALMGSLRRFIQLRNNITHKMLFKYEKIDELSVDAMGAIKEAERLIPLFEQIRKSVMGKLEKQMRAFVKK